MPLQSLRQVAGELVPFFGGGLPVPAAPGFIRGTTKPIAGNTGLHVDGVDPADLQTVAGTQTHSTNGAFFEGKRFTGKVNFNAGGLHYKNCWFNMPHTGSSQGMAVGYAAATKDVVFENCLFLPSSFAANEAGAPLNSLIVGHEFTLLRCDLSGAIDCVNLFGGSASSPAQNVQLLDSFFHDTVLYSPWSLQADNVTHNDYVQMQYGMRNFLMDGCNMPGTVDPAKGQGGDAANPRYPSLAALSVFMASPRTESVGIDNAKITRSWIGGGDAAINWPLAWATNVEISNNRWLRGSHWGDEFTILMYAAQQAAIFGNVWDDTGLPYNGRKNG